MKKLVLLCLIASVALLTNANECENLKLTVDSYLETEDLVAAIQGEFGKDYTIGDWNDLQAISDIDEWISCMELIDDDVFMLTRDGEFIYSGNRQYFVHYFADGIVPGNWLVHDEIANKLFLGSWYDIEMPILAKNETFSIKEEMENHIRIYPNPASISLNIRSEQLQEFRINIFNSNGINVFSSTNNKSIDISGLLPGIYFVRLSDVNGNILLSRKILKE